MTAWWESLGTAGQVFACVAIPATVFLVLQTVLMLIGIGFDHGADGAGHDFDGHDAGGHDFDGAHDMGAHDVGGHDFDGAHDVGAHDFDGGHDMDAHEALLEGHTADHPDHAGLDGGLRLFTFRGIIAFLCVLGWVGVLCVRLALPLPVSVAVAAASGLVAMVLIALLFRFVYSLQADGTENIRDALGASGTVYLRIPPARTGRGKVNLLLGGRLVEKDAVTDETEQIADGEQIVVVGISGGTELIVQRKI